MKNVQEFKDFLKIEFMEEHQAYGHFPFHIVSEDQQNKITLGAMVLSSIGKCYKMFHDTMKGGAKRCYMSVDFPAMKDIEHDFIAVFSYESSTHEMNLVAIPYNGETGERYPEISYKDSEILNEIFKEFAMTVVREAGIV